MLSCDIFLPESLYYNTYNILHRLAINNELFIIINCYEKCARDQCTVCK